MLCKLLVLGGSSLLRKRQNLNFQMTSGGRQYRLANCSERWKMNQPEVNKKIPGFGEGPSRIGLWGSATSRDWKAAHPSAAHCLPQKTNGGKKRNSEMNCG